MTPPPSFRFRESLDSPHHLFHAPQARYWRDAPKQVVGLNPRAVGFNICSAKKEVVG